MLGIIHCLCNLTLRHLFGESTDALTRFIRNQLTDGTQRLPRVLQRSNERAWEALTIALGGQSWWSHVWGKITSDDVHDVSQQIEAFLSSSVVCGLTQEQKKNCLVELKRAGEQGSAPGIHQCP